MPGEPGIEGPPGMPGQQGPAGDKGENGKLLIFHISLEFYRFVKFYIIIR